MTTTYGESVDYLQSKLKTLKKQVAATKAEIAKHPATIAAFFGSLASNPLVSRVSLVEHASGTTPSRKNPVSWNGFKFTFDGKSYWARSGDNWCSSFIDFGVYGDEYGTKALDTIEGVEFPSEKFIESSLEANGEAGTIGLLLLLNNGVIG